MKRTALFFGSFNPIHVGHLIIANSMLQHEGVDELWLVVSPQNPLKERATLLADHHRLQMVQRAIDDNYRLRVCDIEMHLPIPSYTVVTLAALGEKYPDREFCLVMGSDNLLTFNRWRNYEYILSHYRIYVYPRPGYMPPAAQTPPSPPQGGTKKD
jgi:nicotinate-nucleotide adenylyltransferase